MMSVSNCYLRCVRNLAKKIPLPDKEPFIVGRNEDCGIVDLHVSRKHLELTADYSKKTVELKTLGKCYSGCNGYALIQNETYNLKDGDRIEVRLGLHEYDIIFEEEPQPAAKKPKTDIADIFNSVAKKGDDSVKISTGGDWEEIGNNSLLCFTHSECCPQETIAAFDLDGTLIRTKSGARFPKDHNDWVPNYDLVGRKLRQLFAENHKIVIFTNQHKLAGETGRIKGFQTKIENIVAHFNVPLQVFVATGKTIYRKPAPGMWHYLRDHKNGGVLISPETSFYVGDAAGREKNWAPKKNKDHSMADRLFALNLGLKFHTPEEFFLKAFPVPYKLPEFHPGSIQGTLGLPDIKIAHPEVIVMVGCQGSGKSFFVQQNLLPKNVRLISNDTMGGWKKCVRVLEECLEKDQSAVIDNTNPDKVSRQRFIEIARKYGRPCRCFLMDVSHTHSMHNNRFRFYTDKKHQEIPDMLLHAYKNKFEEPDLSEGFTEILRIPFVPRFLQADHEKLYRMYLLEN